jgi:hypothetical protein
MALPSCFCTRVPSPSCPSEFAPQAYTVPSLFSAREWVTPAAMATTPDSPTTCTGL